MHEWLLARVVLREKQKLGTRSSSSVRVECAECEPKNDTPKKVFFSSSQLFHFMTSKIVHHDRNGHNACNFFDCGAMIWSLAKVVGPQSRQKRGPKIPTFQLLEDRSFWHRKWFNMTAVIILVIPLICFDSGSLQLMLVANKLVFYGLPLRNYSQQCLWVNRKNQLICY